jgi:aminoglycoside N3'-acetyltransferase
MAAPAKSLVYKLEFKVVKRIRSMKKRLLRRTRTKVSRTQILEDLRKLGVKEGDVLYVFSSLSRIGNVVGGASTVIDALAEAVGTEGTLVLPCFSLVGDEMTKTLESGRVFDPKTTQTTLGLIPETFRKEPGVLRSIHPTHSVCALGTKGKWITQGHENCATTFGKDTPFDKMVGFNAKVLLLGVDVRVITFYHYFEDVTENFPINPYCEKEYEAKVLVNGKVKKIKVRSHDPKVAETRIDHPDGAFNREYLTDYLVSRRVLKLGLVGEAKSSIIDATDLIEALKELLRRNVTIYSTREEIIRLPSHDA